MNLTKQLLNSAFVGYKELCRSRRVLVLSTEAILPCILQLAESWSSISLPTPSRHSLWPSAKTYIHKLYLHWNLRVARKLISSN